MLIPFIIIIIQNVDIFLSYFKIKAHPPCSKQCCAIVALVVVWTFFIISKNNTDAAVGPTSVNTEVYNTSSTTVIKKSVLTCTLGKYATDAQKS